MADLFNESHQEAAVDDEITGAGDNPAPGSAGHAEPQKQARSSSRPVKSPQEQASALRFEAAFSRLEALVAEMERGELELEEMLSRFEEGVELVRHCNRFLKQAQLRVEQYVEVRDGHWVLKDVEG